MGSANQDATNEVIRPSELTEPYGGIPPVDRRQIKETAMKITSGELSGAHHIVCPFCESGQLLPLGPSFARCVSCALPLLGSALETLRDIVGLPDALGVHPCECGHPEMRRLPDGVFHCPACRSEVLPVDATSGIEEPLDGPEVRRTMWSTGGQ